MTTTVVEARDVAFDRLAGSAFSFIPKFMDSAGVEYQPDTVHVEVVLRGGGTIVQKTRIEGWRMGDPIIAPASWTQMTNPSMDQETHIVRVIADDQDAQKRNELRLIIGCINPER